MIVDIIHQMTDTIEDIVITRFPQVQPQEGEAQGGATRAAFLQAQEGAQGGATHGAVLLHQEEAQGGALEAFSQR